MEEQKARALIRQHGCRLMDSRGTYLIIVNEQVNFVYQCPVSELANIVESDFVSVLQTGHTPKGRPALRGAYTDYRKPKSILE